MEIVEIWFFFAGGVVFGHWLKKHDVLSGAKEKLLRPMVGGPKKKRDDN